jgi:hypothetical protein
VYSLKQAADAVGRGKPAILKAIKNGRISAKKDDNGQWQIDPAELHRVYPVTAAGNGSDTVSGERQETPKESSVIAADIEMLRERLAEKDALIADLRTERDRLLGIVETQAQQVKLLTDQRPATQPAVRRGWWPWRRGK